MGRLTIVVLKTVIALSLAGSLLVQAVLLPLGWIDLTEAGVPVGMRTGVVVTIGGGIVSLRVFAVCIWRLLTLVRRGAVFSDVSFRYVNAIIWSFAAAAVLALALAVTLAPGSVAHGVVGLICGAALVLAGLCLLMIVMRHLLAQAIQREAEARALRAELDEVVWVPIIVDIDLMLVRRKMAVGTLADLVGITPANLAVLKNGRAKAVRFTTLEALCEALDCQPGDLLRWEPEETPH